MTNDDQQNYIINLFNTQAHMTCSAFETREIKNNKHRIEMSRIRWKRIRKKKTKKKRNSHKLIIVVTSSSSVADGKRQQQQHNTLIEVKRVFVVFFFFFSLLRYVCVCVYLICIHSIGRIG